MTQETYEKLKKAVMKQGDAIEDLLGTRLPSIDKEVISDAIDDVLVQMPEDVALEYYNKYVA